MSISRPQISKKLMPLEDLYTRAQESIAEEVPISTARCLEARMEDYSFPKVEIRDSVFEGCIFHHCSFAQASFMDVVFQSCDLSNSKFIGAYFERCRFISCKCVGINMSESIIKQTGFQDSNLRYSNFDKVKVADLLFDRTDFTEASMSEAKLKRFEADKSIFLKNNFFKTALDKVDFSNNEFSLPIVSTPPTELKGVIVNLFQAADLVGLWGISVRQ